MLSFYSQLFLLIRFTYAIQTGSAGKNITYILDGSNLTIFGFGGIYNFSAESTPWYENRTQIISVTILPNITSIGEYSFQGCSNLASVTISDDVTAINHYAFHKCFSLETIILPNNITFIGALTFGSCSRLKTVKLPEKLTLIHNFMFNYCENLKTIKIPDSVTIFGKYCFRWCHYLISIDIPDTVRSIGEGSFLDCPRLQTFRFPKSLAAIRQNTFKYCSSFTSITIPSNIILIEQQAFDLCENLKYVRFEGINSPDFSGDIFSNTNLSIVHVNPKYNDTLFCNYPIEFYPSDCFSYSQQFSESNFFSLTNQFSESSVFSLTNQFSESNVFGLTNQFSKSDLFSMSYIFSSSNTLTLPTKSIQIIAHSLSHLLTYVIRKSVSFSPSYLETNLFSMTYNKDIEDYSYVGTVSYFMKYYPYLIQILSPSYIETYMPIVAEKERGISSEKLIGIVCGSASVFFFILGLIILIVRKKRFAYNDDEFDYLSTSSEYSNSQNENEIISNNDEFSI